MENKHKIVLITGGTKGIGKAIVTHFCKNNYNVFFTYKNSVEEATELEQTLTQQGCNVLAIKCDGTLYNMVEECIKFIANITNQKIDILINNAGICNDNLLIRMTENQFDEVINANLKSVFNFTKLALKYMLANGGSIINISSVVGISGNAGQSNYAASKAAIIGFSKSVAQEYASKNIRCNVVAPGFVETAMTAKITENNLEKIVEKIPLKRLASPNEIANVVGFLASENASYITGETINISGGLYM